MDWLRQVPMGQYVDGSTGWLRRLDPRLKLAWSLVFLLTPVLAGPLWRVGLVVALVLITLGQWPGSLRLWRRRPAGAADDPGRCWWGCWRCLLAGGRLPLRQPSHCALRPSCGWCPPRRGLRAPEALRSGLGS